MNYWILKTEPSAYSFDQLEREKTAVWDGVKNNLALKNLRRMEPGDQVLIYHTGDERALVGRASVVSAAYADPRKKDPKLVVVDLAVGKRLPKPVPLAAIKADPKLGDLALVRMGRLSVVPASAVQWERLLAMAGR
ncbi:MAG TPA: EVE domain-containing protein [Gemmatimonadales bacterium]|nr:EVE domain-containing protein [Gemmatimonadales bacterium]